MAWSKITSEVITKHSNDCKMAFGRKDPNCPRCQELISGAKSRSWGNSRQIEQLRILEIRNHDCKRSGCGPVCTFGEW